MMPAADNNLAASEDNCMKLTRKCVLVVAIALAAGVGGGWVLRFAISTPAAADAAVFNLAL